MTICNMTIEGGGRAGHDRPRRHDVRLGRGPPRRAGRRSTRRRALARPAHRRRARASTRELVVDAGALSPQVTWGTTPEMVAPVTRRRAGARQRGRGARARATWTSSRARRSRTSRSTASSSAPARTRASATCARRREVVRGPQGAATVHAMVVPGSAQVKAQAEAEGLDEVFRAAGFDWRSAGCSMCLGHEPRHPRAGRALRLDLEPQLRGPPGPRRAHPPRVARRWPPRPPSRATSSTSGSWS